VARRLPPDPGGEDILDYHPKGELVMPIGLELCAFCRHKNRGRAGCAAFPRQIPDEVFYVAHDPRRPYPGDGGIQFDLDPDLPPGLLAIYQEHYGGNPPPGGAPA
jgi:hypothetical protein